MLENNKSYRIRTNIGEDKVLNVNLNQNYDTLEILSLKLSQNNAYNVHSSNYGVIVGRVLANGGFGIPNAKISVFIPLAAEDTADVIKAALYPYNSTMSENGDGIKYNLLPNFNINECHQPIGTFPGKEYVLDNDNTLEVFDTYYKFTTRTNNAGDYMIFGVPTGNQNLHVDLDLSDIGFLSQRPRDLMYKGYNATQFENPNQFKIDTNLNSLSQLFSQDTTVNVYPFWGDNSDETIAVTRADIQIQYKFEPTCVFMGSVVSDSPSNAISKRCKPSTNMGVMGELTTGNGTIEMIRKTPQNTVEEFQIQGNELINGDGIWCYQIPMNLDYVVTDEYGNIVPTDDPSKGIPTRTKVRFRVGLQEFDNINSSSVRSKFLVPHNPQTPEETDYVFGTLTKDESYRDLFWNNVYTVKSYIPRFQKGNWNSTMKFTGFKQVNHNGSLNPIPYNNIRIKMSLMFVIMCALIKSYIFIMSIYNVLMRLIPNAIGQDKENRACMYIGGALCPGLESWYFAPSCGISRGTSLDYDEGVAQLNNTLRVAQLEDGQDSKSIDSENSSPSTISCITNKMDYFIQCIEISLAQEYKVIQFDFYNDWLNGLLYIPRWFREVRRKKTFLFGLITVKERVKACTTTGFTNSRDFTQQCAMTYQEQGDSGVYTKIVDENGCDGNKQKCHKRSGRIQFNIFGRYGGIVNDTITNIEGINTNYFKPNQFLNSGRKVQLFATDIVLIGSLNDCDLNGIPQAFKELTSSSYQMPENLAVTNMDSEGFLYGSSGDSVACGTDAAGDPLPVTTIEQSISTQINALMGTDSEVNNIIDNAIEKIPLTEMSGIDWGYIGPGQDTAYTPYKNTIGNNLNQLYFPGGHFLGISCVNAQTNIKSCVNLSRVCEVGVWLSQRQDKITSISDNKYNYTAISPHGVISRDEISDGDFRSMFATMNINKLKTVVKDGKYPTYDFRYNINTNFGGELIDRLKEPYFSQVSTLENLSPSNLPEVKYIEYRRVLEQVNSDYYRFRLGLNDLNNKEETLNRYLGVKYDANNKALVSLPMFENSFYFYFGLHDGSTAIDEFNKLYFSNCVNKQNYGVGVEITTNNIPICNIQNNKNSGTANVKIIGMSPKYNIILNHNDNTIITINNHNSDSYYFENLAPGNYSVMINDDKNNNASQNFVIEEDRFDLTLTSTNFGVDIDTMFEGFDNDIERYEAIINDPKHLDDNYGGIISSDFIASIGGKEYIVGNNYMVGEYSPQILICNEESQTYVASNHESIELMDPTIKNAMIPNTYTKLTYNNVNSNILLWKQETNYKIYLYYSCNENIYDNYTLLNNIYITGKKYIDFEIGNSGTIKYRTHFRPYINKSGADLVTPWWTLDGSKDLFTNIPNRETDMWYLKKTIFKEDITKSSNINVKAIYGTPPSTIELKGQGERIGEDDTTIELLPQNIPLYTTQISDGYSLSLTNINTPTYNYKVNGKERFMFGIRAKDSIPSGVPNDADKGNIYYYDPFFIHIHYDDTFMLPLIYKPFYYEIFTWHNTTSDAAIAISNNVKEVNNYENLDGVKNLMDGRFRGRVYNGITFNEGDSTKVKLISWDINNNNNNDEQWVYINQNNEKLDDFYLNLSNNDTNKNGRVTIIDEPSINNLLSNTYKKNVLTIKQFNPLNDDNPKKGLFPTMQYTESNDSTFFGVFGYNKIGNKLEIKANFSYEIINDEGGVINIEVPGETYYSQYFIIMMENDDKLMEYNLWANDLIMDGYVDTITTYNKINELIKNFSGSKKLSINTELLGDSSEHNINDSVNVNEGEYKYFTILGVYYPHIINVDGQIETVDETLTKSDNPLNSWVLMKQYNVMELLYE